MFNIKQNLAYLLAFLEVHGYHYVCENDVVVYKVPRSKKYFIATPDTYYTPGFYITRKGTIRKDLNTSFKIPQDDYNYYKKVYDRSERK